MKDLTVDGSIIFNMDFENIRCEDVDWMKPEQYGGQITGCCEYGNRPSSSFKTETFMTSYKTISVSKYTLNYRVCYQ